MKQLDWEILTDHLTGRASEADEQKLAEWLRESPEHQQLYDRLKNVWQVEPATAASIDTEKALRQVLVRVGHPPAADGQPALIGNVLPLRSRVAEVVNMPMLLRIAAVIVVALGIYTAVKIFGLGGGVETNSVRFAGIRTLQLSDGTKITFDVGSAFEYPASFRNSANREVTLDGEAYFEVAKDEKHPFIIHANNGEIKVLGTSFAVRAWKSDEEVVVAVKEGRVLFGMKKDKGSDNAIILTDNTMSRVSRENPIPSPATPIEFATYVSWMKKEIYFLNTPVPEVVHQLERWYAVTIQMPDSVASRENITVFIANKPLKENLQILSMILNRPFEQHGDTVRFVAK